MSKTADSPISEQMGICLTVIERLRADGRPESDKVLAAWKAVLADLNTLQVLAQRQAQPSPPHQPQVRLKLLRDFERRLAAERSSNMHALAAVRKLISDGESAASRE